jgi:hypothetical protein
MSLMPQSFEAIIKTKLKPFRNNFTLGGMILRKKTKGQKISWHCHFKEMGLGCHLPV